MNYIKATLEHAEQIYQIVQDTINSVYPKYYPKEVVDFFCQLHNLENIKKDIEKQNVGILIDNQSIVGTGCYQDDHITRVYVLPQYQGNGYGSYIMQCLEGEIAKTYDRVCLDASLPASHLYQKRGYVTIEHCKYEVENDVVLVYEIMEKAISKVSSIVNYDGKLFIPKSNTENGEVNGETIFAYHQNGEIFFADYTGGEIKKGNMIGKVSENGVLDFYYQHMNKSGDIRIGKCHSIPHILENGKVELYEEWQWLNGDKSKGNSIVIER